MAIFPSEPADTIRFMLQHSNAKLLFVGKLDNWDKRASVPDGMPCGGNAHIYFSESRGLGLDGARLAGSASAPIPADVIVWYRKLGLTLLEAYGMTEDFGYSHASSERFNAPGYVGMPYEGVEVRLSDDDPNARAQVEAELAQLRDKINRSASLCERLHMLVALREPWTVENGCLTPTMRSSAIG